MKIAKLLVYFVIALAGIDLLFGDTNTPLLPAWLGNILTPTIDAVLIGIAILALIFVL